MIHRYHFDPLEPIDPYSYSQDISSSDDPETVDRAAMYGCLSFLAAPVIFIIVFCIVAILTGCTTTKDVTTETTEHRITDMMDRMDSLMHVRTVVQQDSAWRETILRQFQSIREKSDTSHIIVQDTDGNVVREKLIINNVREVRSETDRQEREVLMHRLDVQDSTLRVMQQQLSHTDSLLHEKQKEVVRTVKTPFTWWQQMQLWFGRLAMIALAILAAIWFLKKKSWWIPIGK